MIVCRDHAWGENLASCPGCRKVRVGGRHDLQGILVVEGQEEENNWTANLFATGFYRCRRWPSAMLGRLEPHGMVPLDEAHTAAGSVNERRCSSVVASRAG